MLSPKLNNGDLVFENGELIMLDGPEELAQCCEIVLGTNQSEWFLNPALGIKFEKLTGKFINTESVQEEVRSGLRQEPRIATVEAINVHLDTKARENSITFKATSTTGEVIQGGTG